MFFIGANAKLRYQITSGNAKGVFDVEPEIGAIFLSQSLNYEQDVLFELRLVASDGKWENSTLVVINVINLNDEAPVFTQSEYHDSILEELTELPVLVLQVRIHMNADLLLQMFAYMCTQSSPLTSGS